MRWSASRPSAAVSGWGLLQDTAVNKGDLRVQLALVLFRLANQVRQPRDEAPRMVARPVGLLYRLVVQWLLGFDIPWRLQVGPRLRIFHGYGVVVNDEAVLGSDVVLRHGVTIGHTRPGGPSPVIEDGVEFGAGAVALGGITIGANARLAPNSVVLEDVLPSATYRGFPRTWN